MVIGIILSKGLVWAGVAFLRPFACVYTRAVLKFQAILAFSRPLCPADKLSVKSASQTS